MRQAAAARATAEAEAARKAEAAAQQVRCLSRPPLWTLDCNSKAGVDACVRIQSWPQHVCMETANQGDRLSHCQTSMS